jgi:two-component SAPR family response regulator
VSGHDDETIKWKRLKDRELMAYLVHHRNEFVPKETILEDLWPDASPKHSTAYLYTCVYHIRKMLRCMDCTETLESRNNSYRLRLEQSWCDADLMDTAAGWDIHAGNIEECERIVSLYSGGYMGSEEFRWAKKLQEKYEKDYVQLNNRMAAFYAGHGNPDQAAICLSRAHNRRIGTC